MKLWKGDHGQLLINADGKIISCDSCPFGNALTEILDVTVSGFEDVGAAYEHLNGTWRVGVSHQAGASPNQWAHKADAADLCDWDPEAYHFDITWTYSGRDYRALFLLYSGGGYMELAVLVQSMYQGYWTDGLNKIWFLDMAPCYLRYEANATGDYEEGYGGETTISVSVEVVGDCP